MKGRLTCCFCLIFFALQIFGQYTLTGSVVDAENDNALIGVSIVDISTGQGTITDIEGAYTIELTEKQGAISISYLGYQSEEIFYNLETLDKINIQLKSDSYRIDEIVITGPGIKRQRRELGYSADKVNGDEITISNAPNIINALGGKSAGVQIANANGVDGGTTRITIRGNNNIKGNNQPLIIIDGVPLENDPGLTGIGRGTDWGSAINHINPEDIEDINILKGPTAAAKYGTRGANGVIIITTKRGNQSNGLGVGYSLTYKVINPYRYRDVQNVYGAGGPINLLEPTFQMNFEGEPSYPNSVHTSNGPFGRPTTEQFGFYSTGMSWGPQMEGQMIRWWDGEMRAYSPQPDNLKQFFSNGTTATHNLNISGGNEFGTIRLSLTAQDHEAVIPNSEYKQYTANLGSNLNIHEKVNLDLAVSYINFNRKNSPSLGDDNNASFGKGILYSWPRSYKGLEESLNFNEDGTRSNYNGQYPFTFSPQHLWWNTYHQNSFLERNKLIGSIGLTYSPFKWLNVNGRIGLDFNLNEFEERFDPVDLTGVNGAKYSNELERDRVNNNEFLITAFKDNFLNSAFDVRYSVGGSQWSRSQYGINAQANDWQNPWLFTFNNFGQLNESGLPSEVRFEKKINSVFSFLNVSYGDFLFLDVSGRNDWSSALPAENNAYFYPSASISYILTESFDLPLEWLSFLKFRAAFAKTATDTDPFLLDFIYQTGTFGGQQTATTPNIKPPVQLRPQSADSYELGFSLGAFDDRFNADFTYYYIKSLDQILDSPLPTSSGVSEIRINNGVLENYGIELDLNYNIIQRPGFYIETGLNISRNRNFVVSLGDGAKTLELANIWGNFGPNISVQEGQNYGTIYGYDFVYHESGQPILNEEGTHYEISENLVPVGNASPEFIGGWNLKARYRDLSLSTLVDGKIGGDIYAGSYVIGLQTGQSPETLNERMGNGLPYEDPDGNIRNVGVILPGVYASGQQNDKVVHYYYKYLPNAGGWGQLLTTPGILENTWIKMREVALTYNVDGSRFNKQIFQNLQLSLVGRDLFYFYTSLPDRINPEGVSGSGNAQGLEWASFPGMRSISIRAAFQF